MILFTATSTFFELIVYWEKKIGRRGKRESGNRGGEGGREEEKEREKFFLK